MTGNEKLLDEVNTTLAARAVQPEERPWVRADRRRLVPSLALGGASIGMIVGIVSAGPEGLANREELLGVGLVVGVPTGIILGWGLLGLARIVVSPDRSHLVIHAVRLLLAIQTYLGASVAAAAGIRVFSGSADGLLPSIPGVLQASAVLGLLVVPLSFVMARNSTASTTSTLARAIGETLDGGPAASLTSFGGTAIIAFVWVLVTSFAVLGSLVAFKSIAPTGYDVAFDAFGAALGIAILAAWIAIVVAGASFTRRLIYGKGGSNRPRG